jgi:DNA-binding MarR family transcriptional regulator
MTERPAGPADDVSGIGELAGGLRTAVNRLAHALRQPAARKGITPSRLTALATLDGRGPMRPGDLAGRMNISAASMSRLTEALEEGGWIGRDPDPTDGRAYLLSLSDHGRATLDELRRENAGDLAADIRALTPDQRAALSAALPVLAALADRRLDSAPQR